MLCVLDVVVDFRPSRPCYQTLPSPFSSFCVVFCRLHCVSLLVAHSLRPTKRFFISTNLRLLLRLITSSMIGLVWATITQTILCTHETFFGRSFFSCVQLQKHTTLAKEQKELCADELNKLHLHLQHPFLL